MAKPVPTPTPYLSPSQGGNPYLVSGTTGPSLSGSAQPIASGANNTVLFNTGVSYPYAQTTLSGNTSNPFGTSTPIASGSNGSVIYNTGATSSYNNVVNPTQVGPSPVPTPTPPSDPHINLSTGLWDDNYYQTTQASKDAAQASKDAAQAAYNAQNQSLNTQFDRSSADLNAQLPYLSQQRDSALSSLGLTNDTAVNQANSARLSAQTNTNDQINQAGDVAHQTQNQNRNILRALGIGGGTYAAELLSKPLNTYDQQRGQLNQALQQRSQQLDDYLNTVTQQHAQAVGDLQNNYANLVGKIQSDLRFNDRQRNDALQSANAALQTNLANIQSSAQQYQQQVQLMKMQLAQSAGTVTNYANRTADLSQYQNALLSNGQAGQNQGVNIIGGVPQKKGTGFIYDQSGNPIGSSANGNQMIPTLSGGGQ